MEAVEGTRGSDSKAEPLRAEKTSNSSAFMYHGSFAGLLTPGSSAQGWDSRDSLVDFQAVVAAWKPTLARERRPCRSSPAVDPSEFFGAITTLANSNHP